MILGPKWNTRMAMQRKVILALIMFGLWSVASAETTQEKGLAIATEADRRDSGFRDFTADMDMILRNRQGDESARRLRSRTLEVANDGDKSLVIFDEPADVKGTAFLSYTHATSADDQWLYLPALKRVKRISYANTGYTRQLVWFDKQYYRPLKIEFYDRKDALLKTLTYQGYQQYAGQYWRADAMHMVNHQTGKSTDLAWRHYEFRTGLSDRDFDQSSLQRAK